MSDTPGYLMRQQSERIAELERELADARKERDALAAALAGFNSLAATLSLLPRDRRTRAEQMFVEQGAKCIDKVEAILATRDAAKDAEIAALVEALVSARALIYHGYPARAGLTLNDAISAHTRCRTCDGSETVFDEPSAKCPACAGKEAKRAV